MVQMLDEAHRYVGPDNNGDLKTLTTVNCTYLRNMSALFVNTLSRVLNSSEVPCCTPQDHYSEEEWKVLLDSLKEKFVQSVRCQPKPVQPFWEFGGMESLYTGLLRALKQDYQSSNNSNMTMKAAQGFVKAHWGWLREPLQDRKQKAKDVARVEQLHHENAGAQAKAVRLAEAIMKDRELHECAAQKVDKIRAASTSDEAISKTSKQMDELYASVAAYLQEQMFPIVEPVTSNDEMQLGRRGKEDWSSGGFAHAIAQKVRDVRYRMLSKDKDSTATSKDVGVFWIMDSLSCVRLNWFSYLGDALSAATLGPETSILALLPECDSTHLPVLALQQQATNALLKFPAVPLHSRLTSGLTYRYHSRAMPLIWQPSETGEVGDYSQMVHARMAFPPRGQDLKEETREGEESTPQKQRRRSTVAQALPGNWDQTALTATKTMVVNTAPPTVIEVDPSSSEDSEAEEEPQFQLTGRENTKRRRVMGPKRRADRLSNVVRGSILDKARNDVYGAEVWSRLIVVVPRDPNGGWSRNCLDTMIDNNNVLNTRAQLSYVGTNQHCERAKNQGKRIRADFRNRLRAGLRVKWSDEIPESTDCQKCLTRADELKKDIELARKQTADIWSELEKELVHLTLAPKTADGDGDQRELATLHFDTFCKKLGTIPELLQSELGDLCLFTCFDTGASAENLSASLDDLAGVCAPSLRCSVDQDGQLHVSADSAAYYRLDHRKVVWYNDGFGRIGPTPPGQDASMTMPYKLAANVLVAYDDYLPVLRD